jgi:secreted trypsin-like serine protease
MSQNQATDDGGTCYGDPGGPAFWTEPDGTEILVGITSWGDMQKANSPFTPPDPAIEQRITALGTPPP